MRSCLERLKTLASGESPAWRPKTVLLPFISADIPRISAVFGVLSETPMSYDFLLFKPRPGEDPRVTAQRDSNEFSGSVPDPQKEALKRKIADALIAHNPQLEVFQFDYEKIAALEKITVDQARLQYRYLELNGPEDDSNGIQITLFDDEATVTVPFWHDEEAADEIFREIWSYLEIISREAGYLIYDPQTDRILDPSKGIDDALSRYSGVMQQLDETLSPSRRDEKPWWKFW